MDYSIQLHLILGKLQARQWVISALFATTLVSAAWKVVGIVLICLNPLAHPFTVLGDVWVILL